MTTVILAVFSIVFLAYNFMTCDDHLECRNICNGSQFFFYPSALLVHFLLHIIDNLIVFLLVFLWLMITCVQATLLQMQGGETHNL